MQQQTDFPSQTFAEAHRRIQERLYRLHLETGLDHVGSTQSCLEIMSLLFLETLRPEDEFVLSKGHAVSLLYACLAETGKISEEDFARAMRPGGLPAHPPSRELCPAIPYGSGSLAHGFPVAVGMAFARKIKRQPGRIYCLISDGECNEGSIWEAALFAQHHQLDNLFVALDRNHWQCLGSTEEVLALEPLSDKWRAFGFDVVEVEDGHSLKQLRAAFSERGLASAQRKAAESQETQRDLIESSISHPGRPKIIIAQTVKARGLPQYYNKIESHYFRLTHEDYQSLLPEEPS